MNKSHRYHIDFANRPENLQLLDEEDQELVMHLATKTDQYVLSPREVFRLTRINNQIVDHG